MGDHTWAWRNFCFTIEKLKRLARHWAEEISACLCFHKSECARSHTRLLVLVLHQFGGLRFFSQSFDLLHCSSIKPENPSLLLPSNKRHKRLIWLLLNYSAALSILFLTHRLSQIMNCVIKDGIVLPPASVKQFCRKSKKTFQCGLLRWRRRKLLSQ